MKKLILIDGNAILHRAFHALPPLTKNGEIINAVYGFFSMFIKILEDQKPTHIVVCFDRAAPTFRKEMYVGYQSKRPKVSDDLVPQIKKVHDILGNAKISIFEIDGYEADDMIGTISVQAVSGKLDGQMEVVIVSGDRDLLQLVNSHVKMIAPVTGLTNMIVYDSAKVEEKFGIKPSQIVDYKALIGDSSDNYPGITGIGPKTAANLLREYGSFENMYKKIDSLPPKIAEKLVTDAEQAALAKKLATIVIDAPIKLSLEECSFSDSNFQALKNEFERLDFNSLLKRLEPNGSKEKKEPKEPEETEEKKKKGKNHQLGFL